MSPSTPRTHFHRNLSLAGRGKPYLLAHRGYRKAFPENTLPAFQGAFAEEADFVETDLQITADGEIVCFHDQTLDRVTDGHGPLAALRLEELRRLRVTSPVAGQPGAAIPTLSEALAIVPPGRGLALELKSKRLSQPECLRQLISQILASGLADRIVILSFWRRTIRAVHAVTSDLPTGLISLTNPVPWSEPPLLGPFWPLLRLNPWYVRLAHRRGQLVCPLDGDPDRRLAWYLRLGVDALLTDDIRKTRAVLASLPRPVPA